MHNADLWSQTSACTSGMQIRLFSLKSENIEKLRPVTLAPL